MKEGFVKLDRRVAIITSHALGDTLLLMVIARNLLDQGAEVAVFGRASWALRAWFPDVDIRPLPADAQWRETLAPWDTVLQMHVHQPVRDLASLHDNVRILDPLTDDVSNPPMVTRFTEFCRAEFNLPAVHTENGIAPRAGLQHRRYTRRVVIHPEASTPDKRWLPQRFLSLARNLERWGYEVAFVMAPDELPRWNSLLLSRFAVHTFSSLDGLAGWLYESGWFIGNDSGVGHLAANLGVPTLSLFRRRAVAQRWRPAWGNAQVVLPWQWLPGASLKERFWRETLTCSRVLSAFARMTEE
ncbi:MULTISPECIES: glycosyltransferase family 9 protein [unclassified Paraburkholderia]|uniref:glycosyltransferase family 9 protein n=1 Tax=unclassified Paraburkholderia TaxID=2615204 RepID=UPI002AB07924|nr:MULTISPECIES: glycosyltransferase family 9 protein [unclassified Paraburkholderia]